MKGILRFPDDISVLVLTVWCELRDVAKLDSAHCCSDYRNEILTLLASVKFVFASEVAMTQSVG